MDHDPHQVEVLDFSPPSSSDPREHEPWFMVLPDSAKERWRAQWQKDDRVAAVGEDRRRGLRLQTIVSGAAVFLVADFAGFGLGLLSTPLALIVGAGVGASWHGWSMGRTTVALPAILGFLVLRVLFGFGTPLHMMPSLLLLICLSMAAIIPLESERSGV